MEISIKTEKGDGGNPIVKYREEEAIRLAEESLGEFNEAAAKGRNIRYAPSGRVLPTGITYEKLSNSYQAVLTVNRKTETAGYAITMYGEEEAFRLAEESLGEFNEAASKERNIRYAPSGQVLPTGIIYEKHKKCYRVGISVNGKRESASYNITKYGEEEAFRLAKETLDKFKKGATKGRNIRYAPSGRVLPRGIIYNKYNKSYRVRVLVNGKKETESYNITKHGEEEAFRLAKESVDKIIRGVAKEYNIRYAPSGRVLPTGIRYDKKDKSYRVEISVNGKRESAKFAITKYGEEEAFRLTEETLAEFNKGVVKGRIRYAPSGRVLPTGITYDKKDNSYRAVISVNGKTETSAFAITKYGEEEAFRLAEESLDETNATAAKERNIRYAPSGRALPTGIRYDKKSNSYRVGISVNGKTETAGYGITKYGEEEAFRLAKESLAEFDNKKINA